VSLWLTVSNRRCVEVGRTPYLGSSTCLVLSWCVSLPWSTSPFCCLLYRSPWCGPSLCKNCDKTYIGETGRAFRVQLQERRQEVTQQDVKAYTRNTSKSTATEQNKSAVTDHAISLNHVTDWDCAKVIDRESNRMDWWIKEAIHIRNEQDKSMNRDKGSYQLPHIYDYLRSATTTPGGQSFRRKQQRLPKRQQKQ